MDLISIIVPVYKVEKYLDRCVESIVGQTYTNLEIILVDDGSPDQCPAMCDAWARRDGRIRVIHQNNLGVSAARNIGMQISTGEYIAFVDSDDWVEKTYVEVLMGLCIEEQADISACNVKFVDEAGNELDWYTDKRRGKRVCDSQEAFRDLLHGNGFRATPWNKLYKRSVLKGVQFPADKKHEDEFFANKVIASAKKLVYSGECLYNYVQIEQSWMHTKSMGHLDALDAHLERVLFLKEKYPELYLEDRVSLCIACLNHYGMALSGQYSDRKQARTRIADIRKQVHFTFSELKGLSLKNKVYVIGSTGYCIAAFAGLRNIRGGH